MLEAIKERTITITNFIQEGREPEGIKRYGNMGEREVIYTDGVKYVTYRTFA